MANQSAGHDPAPQVVDLAGDAGAAGFLRVEATDPRRRRRLDLDPASDDPEVTVMPLLAVDGRAVPWADRVVAVRVPAGTHLVEVMDDHVYESRTVEVGPGAESRLWVGVDGMRGIARVLVGPRAYAGSARSHRLSPGPKAFLAALAIALALFAVAVPVILAVGDSSPAVTRTLGIAPFALGIAAFFVLRPRFRKGASGKTAEEGAPPPEAVPFAGGARRASLLPSGVRPPAEPGLLLRFAPDTAAVQQLYVTIQAVGAAQGMQPFYSNGFEDWLAPPEVAVDGHPLPSRWGTWWVPLAPGPHTVGVRLPGFADPRRGAAPTGPVAQQAIEVQVGSGPQTVDCRYNIVRMAADRVARDPDSASEWQRVLRSLERLDDAERVASAPPLSLTAAR